MKNIPVYISAAGTATLILQEIPRSGKAFILLQTIGEHQLQALLDDCLAFCRQCGAKQCFVAHGTYALPLPHAYDILILAAAKAAALGDGAAAGDKTAGRGAAVSDGAAAGDKTAGRGAAVSDGAAVVGGASAGDTESAGDAESAGGAESAGTAPEITLVPLSAENEKLYVKLYNRCFAPVSHAVSYDKSQIQRIYRTGQQAWIAYTPDGTPYGIGELHGNELAAVAVLPEFRGRGTALTKALLARCPGPEITLTVASDNDRALGMYEKLEFRVQAKESAWYTLA